MKRPPGVRGILLDIEGTTSSISFVHDVMFPYVREHLSKYLAEHWATEAMDHVRQLVARDDGHPDWSGWLASRSGLPALGDAQIDRSSAMMALERRILELMDGDVKATGLKHLQGLIWESGFHSGELKSHVYPDVLPAIDAWRRSHIDVRIYSSGSIAAQKLFFAHVEGFGDCLSKFSGHYDTTIGSKRESASYARIAEDWRLEPEAILFISDLEPELIAAASARLNVVASVRPGNAPLSSDRPWPKVTSFEALVD